MENKLSDDLKYWRAERPSEWKMDEFIRKAGKMEVRNEKMVSLLSQINGIIIGSKNEIECADGVVSLAHDISEVLGGE
tara:strand:+ start:88604 stop:88837 length:234 start_codon:yes stop_codon:yes gene_type:complete